MTDTLNSSFDITSHCSNFIGVLEHRADRQPENNAYTFLNHGEIESTRLSYRELADKAQAIAARLQSKTVVGQRALLLYPPGLEFVTAFLGCLYAGVIAVPAYPPRKNQYLSRLQAIIEDAEASVLLSNGTYLDRLKQSLNQDSPILNMRWLATDNINIALKLDWKSINITKDMIAFLQYTSGSTGRPKGVMISHGNLMHNSKLIHSYFGHNTASRGVIWLPPYHDMGLIGGVLQPLYGGFPVVLMSAVDFVQKPIRWLKAISRYRATTSGGPNFAYDLCLKRLKLEQLGGIDLSSWKVAFTGAEPIRPETLDKFAQAFEPYGFHREAFYPCYGMAETTLIVSGGEKTAAPVLKHIEKKPLEHNLVVSRDNNGQSGVQTIIGCGKPLPEQTVAIVKPGTLTLCAANQVGEIWVAGPSVAQGYWRNPQETQASFRNYLPEYGEKLFLRTGDLGFVENGELFITGRIKDLIIIRGQNYYPQDIEQTVEKSHLALRPNSGAVFSIQDNGLEQLIVVHEVERANLRKLDVKMVMSNIRQAVTANHKLQIDAMVLVKPGSIPKTSSGKIRRQACKSAFLTGKLMVVEDWSNNPGLKTENLHLKAEANSITHKLSVSP